MRALSPVVILIGFTAVTAQVVLIRELLVLFGGTEISIGLMLASWLAWTALGSGLLGRGASRLRTGFAAARLTAVLEIAVAAVLPLTILAARAGKAAVQTAPGETLGLAVMFFGSLAALGPFCTLSGWLFAAASRLVGSRPGASGADATGKVYWLEAAGAAAGGILSSVLLIGYLDPLQISLLLSLLNLLAAAHLLIAGVPRRLGVMVPLIAVFGGALIPFLAPGLERDSIARLWRPFTVLATANSFYGNLVVAGGEGSVTIYENGLPMATVPDPEAAEEAVHYALLQHPDPRSLLLIGGGVNGSLHEALKHPSLRRLDYVELDPVILDLARRYSPLPLKPGPGVRIHTADGRLFLKTTSASYDVVIVSLPDPQTAQLNRFYTLEFFREARRRLRPGGVLSVRLSFAENYVSPEVAALARCIRLTLGGVFGQVAFLPGPELHLFASDSPDRLLTEASGYVSRLKSRGVQTMYVREYSIPFRMTRERMEAAAGALRPRPATPVNRDFAPVAYYFHSVLWSRRLDQGAGRWLERLSGLGFGPVLAITALVAAAAVALIRRPAACAALAVTTTGLAMIGLQILLLIGFQSIHGSLYHQISLLIALFMAGMAAGCGLGLRAPERALRRRLCVVQAAAAAAPLGLCLSLEALARGSFIPAFGLLALLAGLIGGAQFPLASRLYFRDGEARGLGALYALDLAGSAAGALLISAWLVPLFGLWRTALLVSVASLASLAAVRLRVPRAPAR